MVEATTKTVQVLLDVNFIFENKYTEWLSNVILVNKSSWKWRMYVDYIDLNEHVLKTRTRSQA